MAFMISYTYLFDLKGHVMFIADFHIHSKYSRATSKECVPEVLELWARRKGLNVIGTGDFTHPAWREELKKKLTPSEDGLYTLKKEFRQDDIAHTESAPRFIVSGEISSIYKKNGKVRKVHNLLLLPSFEDAEALSRRLEAIGNLHSDGRPILGLDSRDLLEISLDVVPEVIFIPAHIWTPHFSLFGAYSGFDEISECYEDLTHHIHALETGLSSDPPMNWRLSALDGYTLVSNSDAHSPAKLAREANIFDTGLSYRDISKALETGDGFCGTIEFFPEEGKYHYDGHRNCKVCLKPSDTIAVSGICPVCGRKITLGVLHRVEDLADRCEGFVPSGAKRFESLVPLQEVIASSIGVKGISAKVKGKYESLLRGLGPELFILREAALGDIERTAGSPVAECIRRLRSGTVEKQPGYDGEYGRINIMDKAEIGLLSGQQSLFNDEADKGAKSSDREIKAIKTEAAAVSSDVPNTAVQTANTFTGLNPEQLEAVTSPGRAIAVIAGPGTGKTKTLVSRVAYLVEKCGVPPSQITAVTFTNKAAGEMRNRLERRFGNKRAVKDMTIGTFHSIALKILSGRTKGGIAVIDEQNSIAIIEDVLNNLGLPLQRKTSVSEKPVSCGSPRDMLRGISLIKNGALSAEESGVPPDVYDSYCEQLAQYGALDYDDILVKALEYYEDENEKADLGAFTHLLVDEFQDINAIQYRLIKAWSINSESVFIIGDPDQSIYGFRGSDPQCFDRFLEDFPNTRSISLTHNYRSTPEIIRCAQSMILNKAVDGRILLQEAGRESGAKVRLLEAGDAFSEALFVAKEINRLVGGIEMLEAHSAKRPVSGGIKGFSDIAVLYRTNRQAYTIEQCLLKEGIPYVVAGRDEFLSDPQVLKAAAFFRLLLDPEDLISLKTVLKGTGSSVKSILESYVVSDKSIAALSGILMQSDKTLAGLLLKYEPLVRKGKPPKLIEAWIGDNSLEELRCMEMLLNTSVMHGDMPSLLFNLALGRESDIVRSGRRHYSLDAVTLTTLHGAKGLEFPVVFLCGVSDGLIPFKDRFGNCSLEEERRLFYVGMTRAKDELVLLTLQNPSPFLTELPVKFLERKAARHQTAKQLTFL
jgi:uncharacterized protein (TIGR00375 family)